jgi:prepilin-type N-terminal cleavage/methylation domain-containing protein
MKNRKGLTVIELLVAVVVFALLVTMLVPGLGSFFSRLEVHTALRAVTAGLSAARYQAIRDNRPVRAEVSGGKLLLSRDDGLGWQVIRSFELGNKLSIRANSRPVFSPLGNVSPLCTITLQKERRVWRVVVSMYGRVKVYGGG